ncbi:MAG TPA: hypothetical protein VIO33_16625 [Burkholderiaceae bacterium]
MNTAQHTSAAASRFELRFQHLHKQGRGYAFDCDEAGHVDLDALSPTLRNSYLFARTLIGREYSSPVVVPSTLQ